MKKLLIGLCSTYNLLTNTLIWGSELFGLAIRLWLAKIFLWSGYLKLQSWETTLYLFANEYQVPLISSTQAAYLGTAAELILPILLVLGLGTRLFAIAFFIFNIVMIISYPILLSDNGVCLLKDNILWCVLTAVLIFYGPGKISLDYLLQRTVCPKYKY